MTKRKESQLYYLLKLIQAIVSVIWTILYGIFFCIIMPWKAKGIAREYIKAIKGK